MDDLKQSRFSHHSYRTIKGPSEALYTEKRSKFISIAIPVESEEEALQKVQELKKEYYNARHVCWAFRIGKTEVIERYNDDGEPSSTAGKPILGQLISNNLTDTLVVVVRYFGGVKLGTGGLIVAYRTATSEAILANNIIEHTLYSSYQLSFPFDLINPVMILLRQHNAQTIQSDASAEGHIWVVKVTNKMAQEFENAASALYQLNMKQIMN